MPSLLKSIAKCAASLVAITCSGVVPRSVVVFTRFTLITTTMRIVTAVLCSFFSLLSSSSLNAQWNLLSTGSMKNQFGVRFMTPTKGIITGWDSKSAEVLATYDAGKTWTPTYEVGAYLFGVTSTDSLHLFTVGYQAACSCGLIMKSNDGGLHWDQSTDGSTAGYYAIAFSDKLNGYAVGYQGAVTNTTDGGTTWNEMPLGDGSDVIKSVSFPSKSVGYAVSDSVDYTKPHRIWKTTDAGTTWNKIKDFGKSFSVASMVWITESRGFICGNDGAACIYQTTDGGMNWSAVYHGKTGAVLQAIDFGPGNELVPTIGYAVGDGGLIVRSINGGESWNLEQGGTAENLAAVSIPSSTEVFIVGSNGVTLERSGVQAVASNVASVDAFSVSPNPVAAGTTLHIKPAITSQEYQVEIIDILGNSIKRSTMNSSQHDLSTTGMRTGNYFYRIWDTKGNVQTGKLEIGA